ncbi:expressed protein [Dictyostelium purpureum]|uniref:Expressed protein n=1 Tax=Dictyostelium purpureum TaxID=5786 RepID=F0ZQZ8_DICPU|nr:uncharacterized protein DICPUDRAFT_92376 [Dictyostelium purpureum]EGC33631.1 expressed protein [Dictyostelium purpureum]|eukprot:XP_003289851.1 expressed protein [Dictyostelium purpureum]
MADKSMGFHRCHRFIDLVRVLAARVSLPISKIIILSNKPILMKKELENDSLYSVKELKKLVDLNRIL